MLKHKGKYTGFMLVKDSATGFGEFEIIISERLVCFRTATGKGVLSESLFAPGFKLLSEEETGRISEIDGDPNDHEVEAYRHASDTPTFIFVRRKSANLGVLFMLTGGLADIYGPLALFDEHSMMEFEKMLIEMEKGIGVGLTPRLSSGGCAPRSDKKPN